MLRARPVSQRIAFWPWTARGPVQKRFVSDWNDFSGDSIEGSSRKPNRRSGKAVGGGRRGRDGAQHGNPARFQHIQQGQHVAEDSLKKEVEPRTPSLVEQLFPEETKRYEAAQKILREVPRLALDALQTPAPAKPLASPTSDEPTRSWKAMKLENIMRAAGPGTAMLVLRNATPNLTEEDFRRLIPQGKHIEGWTLEQGDIIKVIPGRNMADLSPKNAYYLLFSSALSAFSYQGHVTRIHTLASQHTPSSDTSPIPPPPGYIIEGLDVHAAIEAYALVPPGQRLELRGIKPPLSPAMQHLLKYKGYQGLVERENKMPFEARLTLEGPQLTLSAVRHEILDSGKKRGLSWSGEDSNTIQMSRWDSERWMSASDDSESAWSRVAERTEEEETKRATYRADRSKPNDSTTSQPKRRSPGVVYIVGFQTERAAQSFVQYWHRRPIGSPKHHDIEGDIPPIANVELLW
ncbi:uncharacterized protein RCC_02188 [Ramularia collo-cygni]|uniref:Uncharacterized protein n=1 Tax=Ramularia collo-cygni TaxID=112498 RepID=A0A2D3UYR8_9PEZI|nr:uncharacterized protein RCC_02188 [Ramularia collo-cygni]CZT16346.1 uncharacterized protein RCC_02188 [Ramularia collo-cygni]